MLYRIRLDLAFSDIDPINDIYDKAMDCLADAITIQPGRPNEERGYIETHICHHDETPPQPCQILNFHQTPTP